MALVSIVIPVYNAEKYLQHCLDSIQKQSYKKLDIICVNDGSTDKSAQILYDYAKNDTRIKVIQQQNQGAGAARNTGLHAAQGKYVLFLDADDYFAPSLVEKLLLCAEFKDADVCICKAWAVSGDKKLAVMNFDNRIFKLYANQVVAAEHLKECLLCCFSVEPWNKLYNRKFLLNVGAEFQPLKKTNDLFFTVVTLMNTQRISLVDEELVYYRLDNRYQLITDYTPSLLNFYDALLAVRKYIDAHSALKIFEKTFFNMAMEVIFYNLCLNMTQAVRKRLLEYLVTIGLPALGFTDTAKEKLLFWCRLQIKLFYLPRCFVIQAMLYKIYKAWTYYQKNSLGAVIKNILRY